MQRLLGKTPTPVSDRLERFRLTAAYRESHETGMVHALQVYLAKHPRLVLETLVFDNIRGLEECQGALNTFPKARFIFLNAPALVRLKRMLGRQDSFDQVAATRLENTAFIENLQVIEGASEVFDLYEVARFEANAGLNEQSILGAVRIISAEQQNYNAEAAAAFLRQNTPPEQFLYLDTSQLSIDQVTAKIQTWL
jgi:hypothetical protein